MAVAIVTRPDKGYTDDDLIWFVGTEILRIDEFVYGILLVGDVFQMGYI